MSMTDSSQSRLLLSGLISDSSLVLFFFTFSIGPKFDYCPPLSQIDSLIVADERGF